MTSKRPDAFKRIGALAIGLVAVIGAHDIRGQTLNDALIEAEDTVVITQGDGPHAAPEGPANTLSLGLRVEGAGETAQVTLNGFYNIGADLAGRFGSDLPAAILAVAVVRETGEIYATHLMNDDDMPPFYQQDAAPSIVQDNAPAGAIGPSELGHFQADLDTMMGLPKAAATLDGFLWLDTLSSDIGSLALPARETDARLRQPRAPNSDVTLAASDASQDGLTLDGPTLTYHPGSNRLRGSAPGARVSIIAMSLPDLNIATTVLSLDDANGLTFDLPLSALLPDASTGTRVLAFAVANGQKSDVADGTVAD